MDFLTDKYVIQKTNMHALHPLRPLLEDALDRPLQGNPVIQQVAAAILDLPPESAPHLGDEFATEMHLRVPPWESPFHLDSSINKITFDPEHPYRPFHDFIRFCEESQVAPLVAELTPSLGPGADDSWGILRVGVLVKQSFSVKPLACLKIHGHLASRPVIAAGTLHLLLNDADFELHCFPTYGLLVSNRLLANCICIHPSRRILPSPPHANPPDDSARSRLSAVLTPSTPWSSPIDIRLPPSPPPSHGATLTYEGMRCSPPPSTPTTSHSTIPPPSSVLPFAPSGSTCGLVDYRSPSPSPCQEHSSPTPPEFSRATVHRRIITARWGFSASPPPVASLLAPPLTSLLRAPCARNGRVKSSPPTSQATEPLSRTSTIGSRTSSAPASLPGGGLQTEYWGLQVRLPHGFKWMKVPHNYSTASLRTAIAIHACAFEEYTPTDLIDNLRSEGYYDVTLANAYYNYYRLRAAYRHERDPSAVETRIAPNAQHPQRSPAAPPLPRHHRHLRHRRHRPPSPIVPRRLHSRRALLRSARIADPLPNQLSSPPVHTPRAPPIATHHITGEITYIVLDGHPFFCPISCDSCTRPGLRYIVDKNCPCARCTTFATAPVATPTDIIAQCHCRLSNIDNISLTDLQHLSEGDLFERLYPIHHTSQENLPELAALAHINHEDALPTDPDNVASWLAFHHSIRRLNYDIDVQHQQRPAPGGGYGHFDHLHSEGATPNIVALTAAASAYMIAEYHPRSDDIPEAAVDSILEIFHYSITRSRILDKLIDDPDFMSLLAARAPQLLPAPNAPPRPRSRAGQTGPLS
ncbi:hypothetical protein BOTBODRAFT_176690 [Botryobasidium botryosum FD-172 SS1]|uniref:Uncharacterized protein n=1 Tax=Botryobasidium botryosum (strain FD-172 SS1) TaxID=930990 RepID=A0A067MJU7_BOTB1|nr:hypothetical protein BOTBODRAFT_176690 [Botryobasidium botryosum FD-172 SS1]